MSKCLCVNPGKEEYLDFGVFEENNHDGSAACSTIEYFLATEWNGDRIIFVFGLGIISITPLTIKFLSKKLKIKLTLKLKSTS